MPFLQIAIACERAQLERAEAALEDAGALSVTLQDADAETPDEQAIFEPGVGETPLWDQLVLTALFNADTDAVWLLSELAASQAHVDWSKAVVTQVEDQDWERAWLDQFQPMRFGERTWVVPWNHALPEDAQRDDAAIVRLDPGLAFGSGTHPTTALCLQWLDDLAARGELNDRTVLDFGCGSGILALAALQLGARDAVGVDNDPQAIIATRDNAERNGLASRMRVYLPNEAPSHTYPVVVANILATALDQLAETIIASVAPGGHLALSGILDGQQDELLQRYGAGCEDLRVTRMDDWVRIDGRKRV